MNQSAEYYNVDRMHIAKFQALVATAFGVYLYIESEAKKDEAYRERLRFLSFVVMGMSVLYFLYAVAFGTKQYARRTRFIKN